MPNYAVFNVSADMCDITVHEKCSFYLKCSRDDRCYHAKTKLTSF